jgi:hypothetical protein
MTVTSRRKATRNARAIEPRGRIVFRWGFINMSSLCG